MHYVRWIMVLPISVLAAIIIPAILKFIAPLGVPKGVDITSWNFYLVVELICSFIMGYIFIFIGVYIAPSKKKETAKILFVISLIILFSLFILNINLKAYWSSFYTIVTGVGALTCVYTLKNNINLLGDQQ